MRILPGIFGTLLSGMWHGYRRWASLFNTLSIGLSVVMAVVILGFALGVRDTIAELVRKEAAAGAVRIHLSGWRPEGAEASFREGVTGADLQLRQLFSAGDYEGYHYWWRSEAHFLMIEHPADSDGRGIYTKLGNTGPEDPEADRVAPYAVGGAWVQQANADQIVLSMQAARKLARSLPEAASAQALIGRTLWITLPGTRDHRPAACAAVTVAGIYDHMRDQACLTTPGVIQRMYARTRANANGRWYETYDEMEYRVLSIDGREGDEGGDFADRGIPLVCWRAPEDRSRWMAVRGQAPVGGLSAAQENERTSVTVQADGADRVFSLDHPSLEILPETERMTPAELDQRYPQGVVLCSPRVWEDLGFEAAPLIPVDPWEDQATYAYLYFDDLAAAVKGRSLLAGWGFETYMPIDRFQGLRSLSRVITAGALALLGAVLLAGLLGILVTLYTEVDAEEKEIGLLKALGASNGTIGWVFLGKGAMIGAIGVAAGVPLAAFLGSMINRGISAAVARTVGLAQVDTGFYSRDPWLVAAVAVGVVTLAALAALLPALQAAGKDPQEALRAE